MNINISRLNMPTTKRIADLNGPDFFPTPIWATYALIDNEEITGNIWECACGDGAMSEVLKLTKNYVYSSDLYDRGYGDVGIDFLKQDMDFDNIITNPPYYNASEFVIHGYKKAKRKLCLLLRLAFLESKNRYNDIFSNIPPTRVWVFSERITFYPKNAQRRGTGTTAYAWFVWDKSNKSDITELKWIAPIYKKMEKKIEKLIGKA